MWEFYSSNLDMVRLLVLVGSAILIGINKTGMPGIGTLPVVMLALVFPTGLSTGIQLMMLCAADIMAVCYYRRGANWRIILKLLPFALIGMAIGSWTLRYVDDGQLRIWIGAIILAMALLNELKKRWINPEKIPSHILFSLLFGLIAGFTTQVANAAGPVMALYLLAMRLPKQEYMGTCAWYFMILNYLKLPIFISEGRITLEAFYLDLPMLPFLLLGAWLGVVFVRKVPQKGFELVIQILIILSALRLLF